MRKRCESFVAATINCAKKLSISYFFRKIFAFCFPKNFRICYRAKFQQFRVRSKRNAKSCEIFLLEPGQFIQGPDKLETRLVYPRPGYIWNQASLSRDQDTFGTIFDYPRTRIQLEPGQLIQGPRCTWNQVSVFRDQDTLVTRLVYPGTSIHWEPGLSRDQDTLEPGLSRDQDTLGTRLVYPGTWIHLDRFIQGPGYTWIGLSRYQDTLGTRLVYTGTSLHLEPGLPRDQNTLGTRLVYPGTRIHWEPGLSRDQDTLGTRLVYPGTRIHQEPGLPRDQDTLGTRFIQGPGYTWNQVSLPGDQDTLETKLVYPGIRIHLEPDQFQKVIKLLTIFYTEKMINKNGQSWCMDILDVFVSCGQSIGRGEEIVRHYRYITYSCFNRSEHFRLLFSTDFRIHLSLNDDIQIGR